MREQALILLWVGEAPKYRQRKADSFELTDDYGRLVRPAVTKSRASKPLRLNNLPAVSVKRRNGAHALIF
jgi:hypothetical protein